MCGRISIKFPISAQAQGNPQTKDHPQSRQNPVMSDVTDPGKPIAFNELNNSLSHVGEEQNQHNY